MTASEECVWCGETTHLQTVHHRSEKAVVRVHTDAYRVSCSGLPSDVQDWHLRALSRPELAVLSAVDHAVWRTVDLREPR